MSKQSKVRFFIDVSQENKAIIAKTGVFITACNYYGKCQKSLRVKTTYFRVMEA